MGAAVSEEEGDGETIEKIDPSESARIGRYELCFHVASGGMASVFLARAQGPAGFTRPVALKRIHPHLARRREFVAMFLDEARIAARINHPNVCAIHDFGEADGAYFIAMEYLVGVPLIRLVNAMVREERTGRSRQGSRRWQALAARIVADAAAGLHAAHELRDEKGVPLGVVHRDVSPQNVFVTFDGAVKVVDFGIALARDRLQHTETGTLKGKLGYMAPEQASSTPVDRRADVWALGVCLWEMLVGARLFQRASPMETLKAVGDGAIPAPSSRRAGIPPELDAITLRALARTPEERHESARDLARELEAFVRATGEPTGLSDLAEWMQPLFAEERAHKSEIVHTMLHAPDVSTELRLKTATATGTTREPTASEGRVGHQTASLPAASSPPEHAVETARLVLERHAATASGAPPGSATSGTSTISARGEATSRAPTSRAPTSSAVTTTGPVTIADGSVEIDDAPVAAKRTATSRRGAMIGLAAALVAIAIVAIVAVLAADGRTAPTTPIVGPPAIVSSASSAPASGAAAVLAPDSAAAAPLAADPEPDSASSAPAPASAREPAAPARASSSAVRDAPRSRRGRAPEPRLAESIQPTYGWVTVAAVGGWAEVWEDDRNLGETPTRVRLRAGRHVLRIRPFGRDPERRIPVTITPDATTPLIIPVR